MEITPEIRTPETSTKKNTVVQPVNTLKDDVAAIVFPAEKKTLPLHKNRFVQKDFSVFTLALYFSVLFLTLFFAVAIRDARAAEAGPSGTSKEANELYRPNPKQHNIVREEGKVIIYKKKNVVEFDGSLIEGEVKNPSEFYFVHRPEEKFGTLIERRKNFHKEMLRDTVMIR